MSHPFLHAADHIAPPPNRFVDRYWARPELFAAEIIGWEQGDGPAAYQGDILRRLATRRRLAVRGPHGLGKSAAASWAIIWFALTRDTAGADWKVVSTASVWRQLSKYLWPEVHRWLSRVNWDAVGRPPLSRHELLTMAIKLRHGEAFAAASDNPEQIEGAHADQLLYIFDEAKAVPADTYDAAEGALAGAGADTDQEAYALAISTPGRPTGRFYQIHTRSPGLEEWDTYHVTLEEAIEAGRISREWADARRRQWGSASAIFQNRVKGEFASSGEDGVIPLEWVEAANERWRQQHPECGWSEGGHRDCRPGGQAAIGVDVGRGGDKSVLAVRFGLSLDEIRRTQKADVMDTAGRARGIMEAAGATAIVDVIGIGAGVVDRLREDDKLRGRVKAFNAAASTKRRDRSGELRFLNARSAAWWNMRELLDPDSGQQVALPPDDNLVGDLCAPRWEVTSSGRIRVEGKDDIRRRLGRSTDDGDAVVQAYWTAPRGGRSRRRRARALSVDAGTSAGRLPAGRRQLRATSSNDRGARRDIFGRSIRS